MATHEQRMEWLKRIREDSPEDVELGLGKTVRLSPAERIRYAEHDRFSEAVYEALTWLIEQDFTVSRNAVLEKALTVKPGLSQDQWDKYQLMARRILTQHKQAHVEGYCSTMIKEAKEVLRWLRDINLDELDVDLHFSPWGTLIVSCNEHADYVKMSDDKYSAGISFDIYTEDIPPGIPPHLIDVYRKIVCIDRTQSGYKTTYKHELWHDLYKIVSSPKDTNYRDIRGSIFYALKDEIIAHTFTGMNAFRLRSLFHVDQRDGSDAEIRATLTDSLVEHLQEKQAETSVSNDLLKKASIERTAQDFFQGIKKIQGELFRLNLFHDLDKKEILKAAIGSTDLKELHYKLGRIRPDPISATSLMIYTPLSPRNLMTALDAFADYQQPIVDFDKMIQRVEMRIVFLSEKEEIAPQELEELRSLQNMISTIREMRDKLNHVDQLQTPE